VCGAQINRLPRTLGECRVERWICRILGFNDMPTPAPVSRYCCPQWHKTVVDRPRRNGVVFLNDASAEAYMKTEGRYWLHGFFGDTPLLRRLLWSVVKPKTPISDESERLALAVTLIREHAGMPSVARYFDYRRIKARKALFSAGAESC
jgi:hypothetical protein